MKTLRATAATDPEAARRLSRMEQLTPAKFALNATIFTVMFSAASALALAALFSIARRRRAG
jgi:hypothetical protein